MHTHRIDVLDAADDHAVVGVVTHDLQLVLLPAVHRLLDQDLADRAGSETVCCDLLELLGGERDPRTTAPEDVRRADHSGQAEVGDHDTGLLHRVGRARAETVEPDAEHRLLEDLAILRRCDRFGVGADHLGLAGHTDQAALEEFHGDVEAGLAAERGEHRIGLFPVDDGRDDLPGERLDVRGVGEVGVGHDGGRVRVGEDDPVALLAQHPARLGAGIVELAGLADHDRAGADDQDGMDVGALGHQRVAPEFVPTLACFIISANSSKR